MKFYCIIWIWIFGAMLAHTEEQPNHSTKPANDPQSKAEEATEDWTESNITTCPVHHVQLEKVRFKINYGLIRRPPDPPELNRTKQFPYSYEEILGGCVIRDDSPEYAWIHRCSECCRLLTEWRAKHPREQAPAHKRPVPPGNQADYVRKIATEGKAENKQPVDQSELKTGDTHNPQPEALFINTALTQPQNDPNENIVVASYVVSIDGTTLFTHTIIHSQPKSGRSKHKCSIGYSRENSDQSTSTYTPILILPDIENDSYVVNFTDGIIDVKTKLGNKEILKLHLEVLAPTAISRMIPEKQTDPRKETAKPTE